MTGRLRTTAVQVMAGGIELEALDISGAGVAAHDGVLLQEPDARALLTDCELSACETCVSVAGGAAVVLRDCSVWGATIW